MTRPRWRALVLTVALLVVIAAIGVLGAAVWWLHRPMPLAADTIELSIDPGTRPREIAFAWVRAGVQVSPDWLYQWFRWSGRSRWIKAGSYEVDRQTTPVHLLDKLVRGDATMGVVRLIDGWTFRQFRAELARAGDLKPQSLAMTDAEVMAAIGAPTLTPEGRFYPDSYTYAKGSGDIAVLRRAYHAMRQRLADAWAQRDPATPLRSPEEALILASLVEKETGAAADRGLVAGVFVNRLRLGMPLQTDPAVIYGIGVGFDGNLRRSHLQTDTPYNTYLRPGLPPTPIAMPGRAALYAAVRPVPTKALYFVSRGDGRSVFSETLAAHNRAVNQYQRGASGVGR